MDCHQAYYLALLRGFFEFLPVSADSQGVMGYLAIGGFLKSIERIGVLPFVIYRPAGVRVAIAGRVARV